MYDAYSLKAVICEKGKDMYEQNRVVNLPATAESLKRALDQLAVTSENMDKFHFRQIDMSGPDGRGLNGYLPQELELTTIDELNYLAVEIGSLSREGKQKLATIYELIEEIPADPLFKHIEYDSKSIAGIINVIHNMDKFKFYENVATWEALGEAAINEMKHNGSMVDAALDEILMYTDCSAYGQSVMERQDGQLLSYGYIGWLNFEPLHYLETGVPEEYKIWAETLAYIRPGALAFSHFEPMVSDGVIETLCGRSTVYDLAKEIGAYIGDISPKTIGGFAEQIISGQTERITQLITKAWGKKVKANPNLRDRHSTRTREEKQEFDRPGELSRKMFVDTLLSDQVDRDCVNRFNEQSRILIRSELVKYPVEIQGNANLCNLLLNKFMYEEIIREYSKFTYKDFLHEAMPDKKQAFQMLSTDQQALLRMRYEILQQKKGVLVEIAKQIIPRYGTRIKELTSQLNFARYEKPDKKPSILDQLKALSPPQRTPDNNGAPSKNNPEL